MSKALEAVACFKKGFNCSQAVFTTYCDQFGVDNEMALKLSCSLGGGMGRQGDTCGAVAGAYLLIGMKYGKVRQEDNDAKEKTYQMVREFARRFKERNNYTSCRELLGIDLLTEDKAVIAEIVKDVCPRMVQDAAEIIEVLLELDCIGQ